MIRIQVDGEPAPSNVVPVVNPDPYQSTIIPTGNAPYAQVAVSDGPPTQLFLSPGNPKGDGTDKGYQVFVRNISNANQVLYLGTNGGVTINNGGIVLNAGDAFDFENVVYNIHAIASAPGGVAAVFIARRV